MGASTGKRNIRSRTTPDTVRVPDSHQDYREKGQKVKDAIVNAPLELKGFYTMLAGTLVQMLSNVSLMQLVGFIVAVAGLVVQVSAYLRNRAETKKAEEELRLKREADKREAELHEARMHFMRRDIGRSNNEAD